MIITQQLNEALSKVLSMSVETGTQKDAAQLARRDYLLKCKATGDQFVVVRELFKEACVDDPVETQWGEFTSWTQFIKQASSLGCGFPAKSTIEKYVKLANSWDIVNKLDLLHLDHCYRLDCTMRIIEWYEEKVKEGLGHLSVADYWTEIYGNKQGTPSKKDLMLEVDSLRSQLKQVVSQETYNYVLEGYQRTAAELEQTKKQLAEANRKLAALSPVTQRTNWTAPVF